MTTLSYTEDANYTNRSNATAAWTGDAHSADYGNKSNSTNETTPNQIWEDAKTTRSQIWADANNSENISNDTVTTAEADQNSSI